MLADTHECNALNLLTNTHTNTNSNSCDGTVKCCCNNEQCESYVHSKTLLIELEKDVRAAASVGKALLERHEKSLHQAEVERLKLRGTIEELEQRMEALETRNEDLEIENTRTMEENRRLLLQLEEYNHNMSLSEIKVKDLQSDLDELHDELTRVSHAAARTDILEAQLSAVESEQSDLRKHLARTKEDEKAAIVRWRQAERTIAELTAELERIEREHRMEKARAQNLMERLEKRRLSERKIDGSSMPSALAERTAMSQFMRDILAENNRLQSGIAELRDMLLTSQEEVGALREQLLHFAKSDAHEHNTPTLSRELLQDNSIVHLGLPAVAPELHFHHHVHKEKPHLRRPKRRGLRSVSTSDYMGNKRSTEVGSSITSPTSPATPGRSSMWSSHNRTQSARGIPSYSSSPQSTTTFRDSGIFDRTFEADSTRPSTADTDWDNASAAANKSRLSYHRRSTRDSLGAPPFSILYTEEIPENPAEEEGHGRHDDVRGEIEPGDDTERDEGDDDEGEEDEDEDEDNEFGSGGRHVEMHQRADSMGISFSRDGSISGGSANTTRPSSPGGNHSILRKSASHESLLVPCTNNNVNTFSTSFAPTSPAAIAAAAASKAQAIPSRNGASRNGASAAYNHLLLAGGSIHGKGLLNRTNSASSSISNSSESRNRGKMGWFGGWGWGATSSSTGFSSQETDNSSNRNTPTVAPSSRGASPAVSIVSTRGKSAASTVVVAQASSIVSTFKSSAPSVCTKSATIDSYGRLVDEQLLHESLLESMQM